MDLTLPVKIIYLENLMLTPIDCAMKMVVYNRPANSKESIVGINRTFSLVNALVYVRRLQYSPWSWLDDFTQPFSWRSLLVRALDFPNKLFLPGVLT